MIVNNNSTLASPNRKRHSFYFPNIGCEIYMRL
jgi:hypothetical protein